MNRKEFYLIYKEVLNNIAKYAEAKNVWIDLLYKDSSIVLSVKDDGKGFELANLSFVDGMGYKNLKSRVDFLKGNIDVKSERGKGTSILIQLPV